MPENLPIKKRKEFVKDLTNFFLVEGVVYYGIDGETKIFVPKNARRMIFRAFHEGPESGHFWTNKTVEKIGQIFGWPELKADVEKWIGQCMVCQLSKNGKMPSVKRRFFEQSQPMKFIAMDIFSCEENKLQVLVIIDRASRFTMLIKLKDLKAATIQRELDERIVRVFGPPCKILTDGGSAFKGVLDDYLKTLGTEHVTGRPYHHQANGITERAIRTTRKVLKNIAKRKLEDWLTPTQLALNTTVHSSTKVSPFKCLFGVEANSRLENFLNEQKNESENVDWTEKCQLIKEVQELARAYDLKAAKQAVLKESTEKRTEFKVNQLILLTPPEELANKMEVLTRGPYIISRIDELGNLRVEHPEHSEIFDVVHPTRVRLWKGSKEEAIECLKQLVKSQEIDLGKNLDKKLEKDLKVKGVNPRHFNPRSLLGERVMVRWTQTGAKGQWPGVLVEYNPLTKRYFVKYDQASDDGSTIYEENVLGITKQKWWIAQTKANYGVQLW